MKTSATLQKIGFFIIQATILLLPLFFLTVTSEFYEFNKLALLIVTSSILTLIMAANFVLDRQVRLLRSPLGLPLLSLFAAWIFSTFLKTPNRLDALVEPGQTSTIIFLILFFLAATNLIRTKKELELAFSTLLVSTAILALITIAWGSGLIPQIIPFKFAQNPTWTPLGSPLTALLLFITLLPLQIILTLKDKSSSTKTLLLSLSILGSVVASGLLIFRLFGSGPNSRPVFLPQAASWAIALESIKISPILGTGPATYLSNFSRFRPLNFNLTPLWNIRFTSAGNYYLQLLSTLGLFGLAAYTFLVLRSSNLFFHIFKSSSEFPFRALALGSTLSLIILFISQLIIPSSIVTLFVIFILLVIATQAFKQMGSSLVHEANIDIVAASDTGIRSPLLPWIFLGLALLLIIPTVYLGSRAYAAEIYFQTALKAAAGNQGKATYDNLLKAMQANPYKDTYRLAYSQTNLLLANSAAAQPNLTAQDRSTITQLIQQSIREAKNAVALNPAKVTNVENLATVYRNLLNLAQGADVWTVASYRQAILLDPANPNLRIALGGVLYSLKNYDEAIRFFQAAADLKPNLPNAHYNLAAAYKEKGDLRNAVASMQVVVNLVDKSSADFTKAAAELEDLKTKLGETAAPTTPEAQTPTQTQLEAPKPLPSPRISPPIELPAELGPDETTNTPAPSPATSPAASPSPAPNQ